MIHEVAEITVKSGEEANFENGVAQAAPLFLRAKGCHGLNLQRVVEDPSIYRLVVQWETVEHHTVDFRNSDDFQEWRRLVGPFFANPPVVTHTTVAASYSVK